MSAINTRNEVEANGNRVVVWDSSIEYEQQARKVAAALQQNDQRVDRVATSAGERVIIFLTDRDTEAFNVAEVVPEGYEIENVTVHNVGGPSVDVVPK